MGAVEKAAPVVAQQPMVALLGNPNCGKTALFNRLTGARQKVANYAGVTIERKEGQFTSGAGNQYRLLDLPGAYSLSAHTPDEMITRDVVAGLREGERSPDVVVCVVDATNLRLNLRLVLEIKRLGLPMVLCLNMVDVANKRGIVVDAARLSRELGMPVVETVAVKSGGEKALVDALDGLWPFHETVSRPLSAIDAVSVEETQREVRRILSVAVKDADDRGNRSEKIDHFVLHPFIGPIILAVLMFCVFQAVFSWAEVPMEMISGGVEHLGALVKAHMADGVLRSLLVDGVLGGVGAVLVFLPQILILFFFILVLEDCGYLPRAAFLLDRLMGGVGLSGRAFIPLLSSFACAIPGIMAARTIQNPRDRIVTIMIAPLMTCSARLPVYALVIARLHPGPRSVGTVQPARPGAVLPLFRRHHLRHGRGLGHEALHARQAQPAADAGTAGLPLAAYAQPGHWPVRARQDFPDARRYHHPDLDGAAVGPVQLPGSTGGRRPIRRSTTAWPACWAARWNSSSPRSASTGRSALRWCRAWRRVKWRSARWAPYMHCRRPATSWRTPCCR